MNKIFITIKLVCNVDDRIIRILHGYEKAFKHEVYKVAGVFQKAQHVFPYPYKNISNAVSWDSKQTVIDEAEKLYQKKKKQHKAVLDYSSVWNSRSYSCHEEGYLLLVMGRDHILTRLKVPFYVHDRQIAQIRNGKLLNMTIKERGDQWFAFVLLEVEKAEPKGNLIMGIDIGIKNPAVAYTSDDCAKFFGNGREIRFLQRSYRRKIKEMQKRHQYEKLRRFDHKLSHILINADHQISRQIVDYAILHEVGTIKLEKLTGIHDTFQVELLPNIYLWSYDRLQHFIQYKAELAGMTVQYVSPYNTSKRCPLCSRLNQPKDRLYLCSYCGYQAHRDLVGARNIMLAL